MEERNFKDHSDKNNSKGNEIDSALEDISSTEDKTLVGVEIHHIVIFNLNYKKDSAEADKFLKDGQRILSAIPGVQNFQVLRQVSVKNDYDFGFSMIFADEGAYLFYNKHPEHVAFVEDRWKKEVCRFLEIDFEI
jgi:hypothetical protein